MQEPWATHRLTSRPQPQGFWELLFTESFVWLEEPEPSKTASVLRIRGMDQLSWEEKGELELFTLAKSLG